MSVIAVLDTETTGLDPKVDRVVEYAHAVIDVNVPTAAFALLHGVSTLCDPGRDIPVLAKAIHHITEGMVAGKPSIGDYLGHLAESGAFDRVTHYAAHNAAFDFGFIGEFLPKRPIIDTWRAAEHLYPGAPSHSNQVLRYWLSAPPLLEVKDGNAHRAEYDVLTTGGLVVKMVEALHDSQGGTDQAIAELVRLSDPKLPILRRNVRVGKYKGQAWATMDKGYCRWVLNMNNPPFDPDTRHTAQYQIAWLAKPRPEGSVWGTAIGANGDLIA